MRLLFIKPKQIGDSLILTPTLLAVKRAYPQAEIWVLIRAGCEGILAGCPAIDRILTLAPVERRERERSQALRDWATLVELRQVVFDSIFELGDGHRGRWFTMLCRGRRRYTVKPDTGLNLLWRNLFTGVSKLDWSRLHRVEKDYLTVSEFLPLPLPIPPLVFERERTETWTPAAAWADFAVMQIGTRQKWNKWSRENWLAVAQHLLGKVKNLVISCGPDPRELADAEWLRAQLGERALCTLGRATWPEVAGLLYRARLIVCPNTAAMHLAAACQCPSVAIFGPSSEVHWLPWQAPSRIVTSKHWRKGIDDPHDNNALLTRQMSDVDVAEVCAACDEMMRPIHEVEG